MLPQGYPKDAVKICRDFVNNPVSYGEILTLDRYLLRGLSWIRTSL